MPLACVPPKTKFSEHLVAYNGLDKKGFKEWLFFPGMLFNATDKWWGDRGARGRPHEGLDLALYRDKNRNNHGLDESIKIPVMYEGKVVTIVNDFIGKTLCIAHNIYNSNENVLFSIYGHLNWGTIGDPKALTLLNPIDFIPHDHTVLGYD